MYKLMQNGLIYRISDGAYIPADEKNSDYVEYLQITAKNPECVEVQEHGGETILKLEKILDAYLDSVAQEKRYANRISCALRAGYPGPFQAEGMAFAVWMDKCNALAYSYLEDVKAGKKPMPGKDFDLVKLLPKMEWPN